ncbi:MAG: hypothetical protein AAB401_16520, partial [Acidobacteriota bacterium]
VKVDKIRHRKGRVESVIGHKPNGERVEFDGDQFISSMPLRRLIQSLDPLPPDAVLEAANSLRYRDYLTVVLMAKREHVFPDNWIYIHSPEVKMGRIQNYKNWSPEMVPDQSRSSLGLEYFLWQKDEEWNWSNDRLIELGIKECAKLDLVQPDEIEDGTVVRMKKAYPVYDHDYTEKVDIIRNYLETLSNLQTVGRNGLHRYNNQDHSMLTAVYAARNIVGEKNDVWAVNTEQDYHEEVRESEAGKVKTMGDRAVPLPVTHTATEADSLADQIIQTAFAKLDPLALGVAIGLVTGIGLLLATIVLLMKGGDFVGPRLGLLRNYLIGFEVTWTGALIGMIEGGVGGFTLGYLGASLRNWGMKAYAHLIRRRVETQAASKVLD